MQLSSETYLECWTHLERCISCTREDEGNRMNFTYVLSEEIEFFGNAEEKEILKYIHLQSKTTLKNMKKLEKIYKKARNRILL